MKNIITRKGISFFVGGLFFVAIGLAIMLYKYNKTMHMPPDTKLLKGVVASDTIRGDTYRIAVDSAKKVSKF